MQFVTSVGHARLADLAAVALRPRIDVHDADRIRRAAPFRVYQRHIGELFGRGLHRQLRRRVERRVGLEQRHDEPPGK